MDSATRFLTSGFFHDSFSPKHLSIPLRPFQIFWKFAEIFAAQGAPSVLLTPVANGKIFNQKNFNYFVWTPLGSRVNIYIDFCLQVHFKESAAWYCFHPPVSLTPVKNLPPVSLIPEVHLDLGISPRIFEKIWNGPNGILWGWGQTDPWKKLEAKNLVTLSL